MSTRLFVGAVITVMSFLSIAICYLGTRNPRAPKWADDTIMGSFILPLATGGLFMGPLFIGEVLLGNLELLSIADMCIALGIFAAGILILFMMRIKKRVAEYDALRNTPEFTVRDDRERQKKNEFKPSGAV